MNKSELIAALAEELEMPINKAAAVLETILESMMAAMERGEGIEIRGFGSFEVRTYEPYTGRNPKTGDQIEVRAKKLPFFKVGKELKERVDG